MSAPLAELTILFADIVGSSRLYAQLGDARAEALVNHSLAAAARICESQGGALVKTIGDAVLCWFAQPAQAARAALALQDSFAEGKSGVAWRVGFHHGPAVRRDGDVFGDAVNVAARVAELAKSRQVLTTAPTVARIPRAEAPTTRPLESVELRGRPGRIGLQEVLTDDADLTSVADAAATGTNDRLALSTLLLAMGSVQRVLTAGEGALMVGRSPQCDFVVEHEKTSRTHLRLEARGGAFFAVDQSTNGTLVELGGKIVLLRRESVRLLGEGWLSPTGRDPLPADRRLQFRVTQDLPRGAGVARHVPRGRAP